MNDWIITISLYKRFDDLPENVLFRKDKVLGEVMWVNM